MKITETVERQCCDPRKDLETIRGHPRGRIFLFCKHCGRHWEDHGSLTPEGNGGIVALAWPWEESKEK